MIDLPRGSLSGQAHILVIVATVIIALFIFRLVRARQLRSKYALLWLVIGVMLLPLAVVFTLTTLGDGSFGTAGLAAGHYSITGTLADGTRVEASSTATGWTAGRSTW